MRSNVKRATLAATTSLIGIVAALIAAEIALRVIGFEFELYPTRVQVGWPDPVTIQRRYQVDRDLLWVPKDYYSRVASWKGRRPSIVFMGDSCTEFGRYDTFFESIMGRHQPDHEFTFANLGVGGWSSYQGLQQLSRDVPPMKPRIVTLYYGWNDHWRSYGIEDKDLGKFNLEYPTFLFMLSRFRVVQLIKQALFALKQSNTGMSQRMPARVSLADFRSNLSRSIRIARDNGIVPVLMTAPSSHQKGSEPAYLVPRWLNDLHELVPLHERYVQAVRDVSAKENVLLIDLYAEFRKLPTEEWKRFFNDDGIHLTPEGNKKIAEILYGHFVNYNVFDPLVD